MENLNTSAEFFEEIEYINQRMKIIALNGSIQASKLGIEADAFKVVTKQMSKLTEDLQEVIKRYGENK